MTIFLDQEALHNVAVVAKMERNLGNEEDYEKIPLSSPIEPCHESTVLDHLQSRTLARLMLGCSTISLLLLTIGSISNQPVLVTEGIHTFTDALCYLIAWIIDIKSKQSIANQAMPFGIRRLTVLGGFFIGCFTATSILFVTLENIRQLFAVQQLDPSTNEFSGWAIAVGFLELFFNAVVLTLHWHGHDHHGHSHHGHSHAVACAHSKGDANIEGAVLHAITDLTTASITIISSVMQLLVAQRALFLVNILGCAMIFSVMLSVAIKLIKENGRILLEGTPPEFPLDLMLSTMQKVDGVVQVKSLRIWQVDDPLNLTGNLIVDLDAESDRATVVQSIRDLCLKFNVTDIIIESR